MLSWKFILSFPVFAQLITLSVADDPTYWVHSSCKAREGFEEALAEVLWGSGQLADALEARDSRQSERLQWLFNFDLDDSTPLGYAIETLRRIASLKNTDDQTTAIVRFQCGNWETFKPKDILGIEFDEPENLEEQKDLVYHDEGNDVWSIGEGLVCKMEPEKILGQTFLFSSKYNAVLLKDPNWEDGQPEDRTLIWLCDSSFRDANKLWVAPTFRELAQGPLDMITAVQNLRDHLALTIIHELVHVPLLSKQDEITWPLEPEHEFIKTVGAHGRDSHGAQELDGYFWTELIGPLLNAWKYTIMNPDSYGYLLMLFILQNKQWESYLDESDGTPRIKFRKNTNLELVGDWPNAGETPPWGSRAQPVN